MDQERLPNRTWLAHFFFEYVVPSVATLMLPLVGRQLPEIDWVPFLWQAAGILLLMAMPLGPRARIAHALIWVGLTMGLLPHPEPRLPLAAAALLTVLGVVFRSVRPAILISTGMAAVIARASGPEGGPDPMLTWLLGLGLEAGSAEIALIAIRKSIHLVFYGCLAGSFLLGLPNRGRQMAGLALVWALSHAAFDEFSQTFAANRTGQWTDVVIDMAGASLAVWLLVQRDRQKGQTESPAPPAQ